MMSELSEWTANSFHYWPESRTGTRRQNQKVDDNIPLGVHLSAKCFHSLLLALADNFEMCRMYILYPKDYNGRNNQALAKTWASSAMATSRQQSSTSLALSSSTFSSGRRWSRPRCAAKCSFKHHTMLPVWGSLMREKKGGWKSGGYRRAPTVQQQMDEIARSLATK